MTLSEAVREFLEELKVGKSRRTVLAYKSALRRLEALLGSDSPVSGLPSEVVPFAQSLEDLSPATVRNYLSAVSEFTRWLAERQLVPGDQDGYERSLRTLKKLRPRSHSLPRTPEDDSVRLFLKSAEKMRGEMGSSERLQAMRDRALVFCVASSGMRISEALQLKRGDLDHSHQSARVLGKGRKERTVYFDEKAWSYLNQYLAARRGGRDRRDTSSQPVFARHDRAANGTLSALSIQRAEQIFDRLSEQAQLDPPINPHGLRHWFATRVLEATGDLAAVQDLLGHESPVTTRIYARLNPSRLREAHRKAF